MATLSFDSTDLRETEAFLSTAYTKMRIGGRGESTRARVSREAMGTVSVDDLAFDYDMTHAAQGAIGRMCLCLVHGGGIVRRYDQGSEGTFGAGDVFLYAPHDRSFAGVIHGATYRLVMFDPRLLDQVAARQPGRDPEPVRLTSDRPTSPAAGRRLRRQVAYLRDHVLADPVNRDAPLVVSTASLVLAAHVLDVFPNTAVSGAVAADHRDAHVGTVRRAVAYIEAHADQPLTLADIAAAAGTTGRAVQTAFRRHRGVTPMEHLRRVRLEGAHDDLQAAHPASGATLADIAARWGFRSTAHFTSAYRRQYGTPPAPTSGSLR